MPIEFDVHGALSTAPPEKYRYFLERNFCLTQPALLIFKAIILVIGFTLGQIAYASPQSLTGIGMTMPVDGLLANGQPETTSLVINTQLPTGVLPFGYQSPPPWALDTSSNTSGSCQTSWKVCYPSWNGQEQDGRLNPTLRAIAASQDARFILLNALWLQLGAIPPDEAAPCGTADAVPCAAALAQLAVTGRHAYNSFISWDQAYASQNAGGPQVDDLFQLARAGYLKIPPVSAATSDSALTAAAARVINDAYTALWAIRSNQPGWRQYRFTAGWLAVSGEDDTPHRPVNVPTAPYPQFDVNVPMVVAGKTFTMTARYMVATNQDAISNSPSGDDRCLGAGAVLWTTANPSPPAPTGCQSASAPNVPLYIKMCYETNLHREMPCSVPRLALPSDDPKQLMSSSSASGFKNVIIYIHGGGSRLEEADPLAQQLTTQFGTWSQNLAIISVDLPNSGYDDQTLQPVGGGNPMALDASAAAFENGPGGTQPQNLLAKYPTNLSTGFPVLNFTINFVNNFIQTLGQQGVIDPTKVLAVMGGSLGGNTSLILAMNQLPSPFKLNNPVSFSTPPLRAGDPPRTFIAWSPTSMVDSGNYPTIMEVNMCCYFASCTLHGIKTTCNQPGVGWEKEGTGTRAGYFSRLYFQPTTYISGTNFPGLPPDPEMWYRDDWTDSAGDSFTTSLITQSRFDRYEVYSPLMRLWTTAIDTEQATFTFQVNVDTSHNTYKPYYASINGRLLLAAGACDDYDNGGNTAPFAPPPTFSTGNCAGAGLGHTGSNKLTHQDIYGFTHDVANDMRNATGLTLFLNDTGHSIHDERPEFFSQQIYNFLTNADNNINISFFTGSDGLRWNSEIDAMAMWGFEPMTISDFGLNYWFHPWPSYYQSPDNICGFLCEALTSFQLPQSASSTSLTVNNFTIALPPGVTPTIFAFLFVSGQSKVTDTEDGWNVAAVAMCQQGQGSGFANAGFPLTTSTTLQRFGQGTDVTLWYAPIGVPDTPINCNGMLTNPPANTAVPARMWNGSLSQVNINI